MAFGGESGSSGSAPDLNPGYNGDQSSGGLVYMRNRWCDPNTGRSTQEDPIGFAGGINLYGYTGNNPVMFRDPFGLEADSVKVHGYAAFHEAVAKACAGEAKKECGELQKSDKVFWVVQGSFSCPFVDSKQAVTGRAGCDHPQGNSYEGTNGSPRHAAPPGLVKEVGGGPITGGLMLINDQRPLVSGLGATIRHEMVHELGVARGGGLILGHTCANPAWSGIANTGCR